MQLRDNAGGFLLMGEMTTRRTVFGVPYVSTNQVPENLGAGGNESEIYLADFSEVIIGDTLAAELKVTEGAAYHDGSAVVSGLSQDQTVASVIMEHDIAVKHDTSLAVLSGCTWTI